jgi:short-subunit dehydrogenase
LIARAPSFSLVPERIARQDPGEFIVCGTILSQGGQRIVITGASRGIGRQAALALAKRGEHLVLVARQLGPLEEVATEARKRGAASTQVVSIDVTEGASVETGARRIVEAGAVDVLINNAGGCIQAPFLQRTAAELEHEMSLNYFGAQRLTRALLPSMLDRGSGTILNVSSLLGAVPCPTTANYSAAKAALNAWSHALRGEVAARGVRVVVFMPSHTQTEGGQHARFDGVPILPLEYTVEQLLYALDHKPRSYTTSPFFRLFVWLAGVFPGWAERQMAASTRAMVSYQA